MLKGRNDVWIGIFILVSSLFIALSWESWLNLKALLSEFMKLVNECVTGIKFT